MKFFFLILISLFIYSCKNKDRKSIEKKIFIVSKFNDDVENHNQEALAKNPELLNIKEIKLYDYPKGAVNFIFLNDGTVYFHNEELIFNFCGWGSDKIKPTIRNLTKDSLHQIRFNQIYPLLKSKSLEKNMKDNFDRLKPLSFSFENDTVKNFDFYKLLQDIDSLGYHSFTVRRIAPFETENINTQK